MQKSSAMRLRGPITLDEIMRNIKYEKKMEGSPIKLKKLAAKKISFK